MKGTEEKWVSIRPGTDGALAQGIAYVIINEELYDKDFFWYYTNPLFFSPEVRPFYEAFEKVPFIVSFSPFLDDSTAFADLVLPDHSYLERLHDVSPPPSLGYPVVGLGQPVVAPLFDTRHTGDVLLDLVHGLGEPVGQSFPWRSFAEMVQYRISGLWYAELGDITATEFEFCWEEFAWRSLLSPSIPKISIGRPQVVDRALATQPERALLACCDLVRRLR